MRLRLLLLLTAAALHGCATQTTGPSTAATATLRAAADSFSLRGKLGVRTPGAGHSLRILWDQRSSEFDIELSGPVGIGRTRLTGTADRVTISDRQGSRVFDDPALALQTELGWSPPLDALPFWSVGVPAPGLPHRRLEAATEPPLARFEQAGWIVEVQQLADYGQWTLPRKLSLTQGQTRLRLVATDWQVPARSD